LIKAAVAAFFHSENCGNSGYSDSDKSFLYLFKEHGGFMVETLVKANEVERLIAPIFGNRQITAVVADQTVILTITDIRPDNTPKEFAPNKLSGLLADTDISSYKFMENKKHEKELEEEKFTRNRA
jgi:hypothetical protein